MTAADEAFAAAERLVEEARESGAKSLDFDREDCRALDRLPDGIAGLTGLRELRLTNTQVSDLSPLAGLTGLTRLWLESTPVNDLSPIAGLTRLTWLSLDSTPVSDLSPIADLKGLTRLSLMWMQVSDLSPLSGLTGLTLLQLDEAQVSDLSPLGGLTGLEWLTLSGTKVSDLSSLHKLTGLKGLLLHGTQVRDLLPLAGLKGLKQLGLNGNPATDLRPLRKLTRLATEPVAGGLTFIGTGASRLDPRIAGIAEIEDDAERARVLFGYMEGWEPPETGGVVPPPPPRPEDRDDPTPFLFISYSEKDRLRIAEFCNIFRKLDLPIWWDQDIAAGTGWRKVITDRLAAAQAVVTFWTSASAASDAVREEASLAQRARKLVPVRLDDAELPFGFAETQYVDLRHWDGTAAHPQMQKLLTALRDKLWPPTAAEMVARLAAASPIAMLPREGRLSPVDTPPHNPPEVENAADLAARLDGLRQTVSSLQDMAADRQNYQLPTDLNHALSGAKRALTASPLSWYGIVFARALLGDCVEEHDAAQSWPTVTYRAVMRLMDGMADLRPLLQPRQVPADLPGARPLEPDPVIGQGEVEDAVEVADAVSRAVDEGTETLDRSAIDLVQSEVGRLKAAKDTIDHGRRFYRLRRALRGLTYLTGSILTGVAAGISANLLTSAEAARTLAQKLQPLFERLVKFFM
jgi:hypothetical protein